MRLKTIDPTGDLFNEDSFSDIKDLLLGEWKLLTNYEFPELGYGASNRCYYKIELRHKKERVVSFSMEEMPACCGVIVAHTLRLCNHKPNHKPEELRKLLEVITYATGRLTGYSLVTFVDSKNISWGELLMEPSPSEFPYKDC